MLQKAERISRNMSSVAAKAQWDVFVNASSVSVQLDSRQSKCIIPFVPGRIEFNQSWANLRAVGAFEGSFLGLDSSFGIPKRRNGGDYARYCRSLSCV